jgi:hypothetical protein
MVHIDELPYLNKNNFSADFSVKLDMHNPNFVEANIDKNKVQLLFMIGFYKRNKYK